MSVCTRAVPKRLDPIDCACFNTRNVARLPGPGVDGRSKTVTITPNGKRRLDAALPLWEAAQEEVLRVFGAKR
ncbi:MAG: MarR family winged helix-turn-helix transcriptional regulator [Myxococcales bacterium]|nr:MarR family winged helix-turn-helix transcriptional regulator [Myxococcales bacterium]